MTKGDEEFRASRVYPVLALWAAFYVLAMAGALFWGTRYVDVETASIGPLTTGSIATPAAH